MSEATQIVSKDYGEETSVFWLQSQKAIDPRCLCLLLDFCGARVHLFVGCGPDKGREGRA